MVKIAGREITSPLAQQALERIQYNQLLREHGYHNGDDNFSEAELIALLDIENSQTAGVINEADYTCRYGPGVLLSHAEFIALTQEYQRQFPHGQRRVESQLWTDPSPFLRPRTMNQNLSTPHRFSLTHRILENINWIRTLPHTEREAAWQSAIALLRQENFSIPSGITSYETFEQALRECHIDFLTRFRSLKTILNVIANRRWIATGTPPFSTPDPRPIAVVIGPKHDSTRAFDQFPLTDTFSNSNRFQVFYVEAGNETEMLTALAQIHQRTGRPIHTLAIEGHGTEDVLALNREPTDFIVTRNTRNYAFDSHEGDYLDPQDFTQANFRILTEVMDPHGQIFLSACSNGRGGRQARNLANSFAAFLPGRRVYAQESNSGIESLSFNDDLSLNLKLFGVLTSPYERTRLGQFLQTPAPIDRVYTTIHPPTPR